MPTTLPTKSTPLHARLFRKGRSQAVRLPEECRLPGSEVLIYREGDRVVMEPSDGSWSPAVVAMLTAAKPLDLQRPPRGRKAVIGPLR